MPFDINAAKEAGYSTEEITAFLAEQNPDFDVEGAISSGYNPDEVADFLAKSVSDTPKKGLLRRTIEKSAELYAKIPELAIRSTADLPLGILQAGSETPTVKNDKGESVPMRLEDGTVINDPNTSVLSDVGKQTLAAIGRATGSNIQAEDIDATNKGITESVARVTQGTDQVADEVGDDSWYSGGNLVRGVTQGLQIPMPAPVRGVSQVGPAGKSWVSKGATIVVDKFVKDPTVRSQLLKTAVVGGTTGTAAGYVQPQASLDAETRTENRNRNAEVGGVIGAVLPTAVVGVTKGVTGVRNSLTESGSKRRIAREFQQSMTPAQRQASVDALDERLLREEAMNANVPPEQAYKSNPATAMVSSKLDEFNQELAEVNPSFTIDGVDVPRSNFLIDRQRQNEAFIGNSVDELYNPNATTESLESTAKNLTDNAVDTFNNVMDDTKQALVKANPNLTNQQANEITGKYVREIYSGFNDKIKDAYAKVADLPAQATPVIKSLKVAAKNKAMEAELRSQPALNELLDSKNVSQITGIEKIVQAKAELSRLAKDARNAKEGVRANMFRDLQKNVESFLDNHPDERIKQANIEADDLYKRYQDALRRGGFNEPGLGKKVEQFVKSDGTVVNDSQLRGNFYPEGVDAPTETAADLSRMGNAAEAEFGLPNTLSSQNRDYLYADLKATLKDNPTKGAYQSWYQKHSSVFKEFPELKDEFEPLTNELRSNQDVISYAKKIQDKDPTAVFNPLVAKPEEMSAAIKLAQRDKSGKALSELQDQFGQKIKDVLGKQNNITTVSSITRYFKEGTSESKAVKQLFATNPDKYKQWKLVSDLMEENAYDTTRSGSPVKSNTGDTVGDKAVEAASRATTTASQAFFIKRAYKTMTSVGRNKVLNKLTTDSKYAKDILNMDTNLPAADRWNKISQAFEKVAGERIAPFTAFSTKEDTTEEDMKITPKVTPSKVPAGVKKKSEEPKPVVLMKDDGDVSVSSKGDTKSKVINAAKKAGIKPKLALSFANAESSMGKKSSNVFQVLSQAEADMRKKLGNDKLNANNHDDSIVLGVSYIKENYDDLKKSLGREPEGWELYGAHFLGPNGFKKALANKDNTRVPGHKIVPTGATNGSNKKFFFNSKTGKPFSMRKVLQNIKAYYRTKEVEE